MNDPLTMTVAIAFRFRHSRPRPISLTYKYESRPVCDFVYVIVLSHWPHVATQVAQLVASVKGLGHKLSNLIVWQHVVSVKAL